MSDPLNLKKHIREVKDFPIEGINFRDITSLIENPEAFQTTCKELIEVSKNFNASVIASIESRGFIFAGSISFELGLPFVLARKPGKLPNETFKKDFDLEYGSTSIEIQKNTTFKSSDRVVIVRPPPILVDLEICDKDEFWLLNRALYGLRESPRYWGLERDEQLQNMTFRSGKHEYFLQL